MFDISWGEILVVAVVGAAVTGRKDLPAACRMVGMQLGRVVGFLQGARARADQFAAQNELKQLQNELRSGLRELDQVRTELAIAASTSGMIGKSLGTTTASANRILLHHPSSAGGTASSLSQNNIATTTTTPLPSKIGSTTMAMKPLQNTIELTAQSLSTIGIPQSNIDLSSSPVASLSSSSLPRAHRPVVLSSASHSERAILEEEWEKQGIGFQTRAERLRKQQQQGASMRTNNIAIIKSGSEILEDLIKQNLIFDQYDRVVGEQDAQLQERITNLKEKRQQQQQQTKQPQKQE